MLLRIAVFNTALSRPESGALKEAILSGKDAQAQQVAAIIKEVNPDILLLNEFDYEAGGVALKTFMSLYLDAEQSNPQYPYFFLRGVNTGLPSGRDFDKDGIALDKGGDALGFGLYPGHYGMALLSKYPINESQSRTFQHFKWRDMPNALLPKKANGDGWYDDDDLSVLPLSSKSHWNVQIDINGEPIQVLCSHPTPPVFDGPEKRNACRNHDEIRFWTDYIIGENYHYDDDGHYQELSKQRPFVVLGDLNASITEGDAINSGIEGLLQSPFLQTHSVPESEGAEKHSPDTPFASTHTASWRIRADYVLPSTHFKVASANVFWPIADHPLARTVETASDHRMVYLDLVLRK